MVQGRVPVQRRLSRSRGGRIRPRGSGDRPYPGRGHLSDGALLTVGISRASGAVTGTYDLQPVRFARSGIAARLLELLGPDTAHAEWGWVTSHPRSSGVTLAGKRVFGWAASLVDKVSAFAADHGMDIIKGAGELLSMAVGLDDFIILTKAMAALAAGATDEIETVEVCFAAAGAILTIAEVVSLGTLAPAAESLKWGLDGFKLALKGMGPDGVKAALGMAKGLWKVIKEVATDRRAALVLVKDTSAAIVHLAGNVGQPVFQAFVAVIRSPMDFMNWVKTLRAFRRSGGCLISDADGLDRDIMLAATASDYRNRLAVMFLAMFDFFVADAHAADPPVCDQNFSSAVSKLFTLLGEAKAPKGVEEFNKAVARIESELISTYNLDRLQIGGSTVDGMIAMLQHGRHGNNIFYIAKSVAKRAQEMKLSPAERAAVIGKYFRLIGEIDKIDDIQDGNKLWGDMGKFLHKTYSDHFITGIFHQLEVMEELRKAGKKIKKLEERTDFFNENGKNVGRYSDIVLEGGHRIEVKNYTNYGKANRGRVTKGLEKDLVHFIDEAEGDAEFLRKEIDKISIVFRGGVNLDKANALKLVDEMMDTGKGLLDNKRYNRVWIKYKGKLEKIKNAIENGGEDITKSIPELGDLITFQNKRVPY